MNITKQVCTLEQAKRLKELGVDSASAFRWNQNMYENPGDIKEGVWTIWYNPMPHMSANQLPAFTVAELGVVLPPRCYSIQSEDSFDKERGEFICISQRLGETRQYGETEAQARAAMLIHLLENNIITAEQVNNRLKNS